MRNSDLLRDDIACNAVGLAEVGVAGRDDAPTVTPVLRVIQELDYLLWNGATFISSTVGGDHQDVVVVDRQESVRRPEWDSFRW